MLTGIDEIQNGGLKMMVIIVNRADGDKMAKFLKESQFHIQFTCMAVGTQGSELLDLLGIGSVHKTVVFCVSPGVRIDALLPDVARQFNLKKAGKGIAFTIPLTGASVPRIASAKVALINDRLRNLDDGVDKMYDEIQYSVILAVIDAGNSEELVETARDAGAKGGTVINARRTGADEAVKFFGLTVQSEKEIVAILTTRENKRAIMDAIEEGYGFTSPAHGLILSVPVDGVVGANL